MHTSKLMNLRHRMWSELICRIRMMTGGFSNGGRIWNRVIHTRLSNEGAHEQEVIFEGALVPLPLGRVHMPRGACNHERITRQRIAGLPPDLYLR